MIKIEKCSAILLDVEGTTTPISFVHTTLFNYAKAKMNDFVSQNWDSTEIRRLLSELLEMLRRDREYESMASRMRNDVIGEEEELVEYIVWLIDRDSKAGPLKELEGRIWADGYEKGEIQGEVYPDVPIALKRWNEKGKSVAIYSSGSELSQRYLFATTKYGNLTAFIKRFFDTKVGAKLDPASYQKISGELGVGSGETLFLSDSYQEIQAARLAGLKAIAVRRGSSVSNATEEAIMDFSAICQA